MNPNAPKENANPVIRSVVQPKKERLRQQRQGHANVLDWNQFGSFSKEGQQDVSASTYTNESLWKPNSAADNAILQGLVDVSKASHGRNIALLENAGLVLPSSFSSYSRSNPTLSFIDERDTTMTDKETSKSVSEATSGGTVGASSTSTRDTIDAEEVFDIIRNIQDPEHPNTLEQLSVVSLEQVEVVDGQSQNMNQDQDNATPSASSSSVKVRFTPTIPHCSMATLIGLCVTVKLMRSLPYPHYKIQVQIEPGTHASEKAINKQLRDKERVCAALENKHLAGVVNKCILQGAESSLQ